MLKYLLMILGFGLFGSASALAAYDIFLATQLRRLLHRKPPDRTVLASHASPSSSGSDFQEAADMPAAAPPGARGFAAWRPNSSPARTV